MNQFQQTHKRLQAENMVLSQNVGDLDTMRKDLIRDMRQNEIINEKETYKLNAKLKEYKYIIHE